MPTPRVSVHASIMTKEKAKKKKEQRKEAGAGFEPANSGFADHSVGPLRHPAFQDELYQKSKKTPLTPPLITLKICQPLGCCSRGTFLLS